MSNEDRIRALLNATPDVLAAVDAALAGRTPDTERPCLKLFCMSAAARETGISRSTLWRAIKEGKLRTVEIRAGRHRIPEAELRALVEGRAAG